MLIQRLFSWTVGAVLAAICGVANGQPTVSNQPTTDSVFINGRVLDETKEGMIGAIVQLREDSVTIAWTVTDEEGDFHLYRPKAALENACIRVAYQSYKTNETLLKNFKKPRIIQMQLNPNVGFRCPVVDVIYRVPLIDHWGPTQRTFLSDDIEQMPH